jgi:hypothetical protein
MLFWALLAVNLYFVTKLRIINRGAKKWMIVFNVLLGLVYGISCFVLWMNVDQWISWNITSNWSPLLVTPHRVPNMPTVETPVFPLWNIPFILFLVMLATNLYFILQKSKTATHNPT